MIKTICGIEIERLIKKPTPQELGAIVAEWNDQKQVDFFLALDKSLRNCCAGKPFLQWQAIANTIIKTEEELCDGSASQFFKEIQSRLEPQQQPPQNPTKPDNVEVLWSLVATLRASLRVMLALMESDVKLKCVSYGETRQKVMTEARALVPEIKVQWLYVYNDGCKTRRNQFSNPYDKRLSCC